ncbi:MAG: tRNA (adenosine(37)-N6)-threonylcarbamoyltransferase complex ATPase subunit type 1 TsaE [Alphaproteobacteria bacterium]|nr:MAG: tRNA (adenosine(37)-N6)-threonylcarbamoyltransferase complex ATPase subunit type 1 TsaE [Alphaproteobacteria bacterium]
MSHTLLEVALPDETATERLGARLAACLEPGDVLCLKGDLGAGKTALARGLLRALSGQSSLVVPSPTFTLVQTYELDPCPVWHFDLYRLEDPDEIWELGFEEALGDICLIEWPERAEGLIPEEAATLEIRYDDGARTARLKGPVAWKEKLAHVN